MLFKKTSALAADGLLWTPIAQAQQVTIGSPFTRQQSNFNEQFGSGFGFSVKGGRPRADDRGRSSTFGFGPNGAILFQQGPGAQNVQPPFGGFQAGNRANGGFQVGGSGFNFNFGLTGVQGSSQSLVSQTPTVTTFNGQPAMFSDQVQQPFVLGITPIVGNGMPNNMFNPRTTAPRLTMPPSPSPLMQRLQRLRQGEGRSTNNAGAARAVPNRPLTFNDRLRDAGDSTAGQAALSVSEIQRRQADVAQVHNEVALENYRRGVEAEQKGKDGVAKIFYRMATKDASGDLKNLAQERLSRLENPPRRSAGGR